MNTFTRVYMLTLLAIFWLVSMFLLSLAGVDDASYSLAPGQETGKSPGIIPSQDR